MKDSSDPAFSDDDTSLPSDASLIQQDSASTQQDKPRRVAVKRVSSQSRRTGSNKDTSLSPQFKRSKVEDVQARVLSFQEALQFTVTLPAETQADEGKENRKKIDLNDSTLLDADEYLSMIRKTSGLSKDFDGTAETNNVEAIKDPFLPQSKECKLKPDDASFLVVPSLQPLESSKSSEDEDNIGSMLLNKLPQRSLFPLHKDDDLDERCDVSVFRGDQVECFCQDDDGTYTSADVNMDVIKNESIAEWKQFLAMFNRMVGMNCCFSAREKNKYLRERLSPGAQKVANIVDPGFKKYRIMLQAVNKYFQNLWMDNADNLCQLLMLPRTIGPLPAYRKLQKFLRHLETFNSEFLENIIHTEEVDGSLLHNVFVDLLSDDEMEFLRASEHFATKKGGKIDVLVQWAIERFSEDLAKEVINESEEGDILLHSSVDDYVGIRLMYNLPIGLFIGWAIYNLAWHRLDFGYFNAFYSIVFQWTVIFGSGLAFAVSPVFRCATICVCLGGLSKSGQGLLTLYVVEQIQQGPVDNILYNIELTANIIVCHLELQGQLVKQKMSLMTGPVEALFEKHFGTGVSVGKKTVAMLKSLIEPFNDQLGIENDEDKELANVLDGQKAMAERDRILNEESTTTEETATTVTTESNFKSKPSLGKLNSNRMEQRCEATYAMAARQCKDRFSDAQAKCYDSLPLIGLIVCWQFNSDDFCKPSKMEEVARKTCAKFTKSNKTDADMNDKMQNLNELKEQLDNELKVNLHFKVIEQPRDERIRMLAEIMATLRSDLDLIRVISKSTNELLSAFLIFLVYMIFKGAVNMIRSYLTDINFKNIFLSQYFWRIDYKRMLMGQIYLGKVKRSEKKVYHLKHMFGLPTSAELYKTWKALLQFVLLLFLVGCIVAFDHVLYRILSIITEFLTAEAEQTGRHVVDVQVVGNGSIAEMVRSIIQFNYTDTQQRELSNKVCMVSPKQLDQRQFVYNILLPLVVMFALQVLLNYIVTRLVLFYVIGFIFRSRSKQRTVYLYNKVLARRLNDRRLAIARVKYLVVEDELDPVVVKEPKNRISRFFYQFKQLKCVLCLTKHRISSMGFCEDCKTYYCTECMEILEDSCLVCDTRSNMK